MVMNKDTDLILRDTQIIVDLKKTARNMQMIRQMVGPDIAIMAVVKANAYGHGAVQIAPTLMENGADYLSVATLTEALELREAYDNYPIFIMGHTPDRFLRYVVENDIAQTVFSLKQVKILGEIAGETGKTAKVHIKVDTGFHRLGTAPSEEFAKEIQAMFDVKNVEVEGIFSHLALTNAEEDEKQYRTLTDFTDLLESRGCKFKYKHIADSIATVDYPQYRLNMVRVGALMYGVRTFSVGMLPVEQIMTFRTAISQLHRIKEGEGVSYDYLWRAQRDSIIATLPFGYADGYPRNLRDKGFVIINGHKAPLVGVLCMDQCMADVTDVPNVCEGMEAIIYGDAKDGAMDLELASKLAGTNKNEIISRILSRPPRKYIR